MSVTNRGVDHVEEVHDKPTLGLLCPVTTGLM